MTRDLLAKLPLLGEDQEGFSLDIMWIFHRGAVTAGCRLRDGDAS